MVEDDIAAEEVQEMLQYKEEIQKQLIEVRIRNYFPKSKTYFI